MDIDKYLARLGIYSKSNRQDPRETNKSAYGTSQKNIEIFEGNGRLRNYLRRRKQHRRIEIVAAL